MRYYRIEKISNYRKKNRICYSTLHRIAVFLRKAAFTRATFLRAIY